MKCMKKKDQDPSQVKKLDLDRKILKDEVWSEREVLGGEEAIGIKKDREK